MCLQLYNELHGLSYGRHGYKQMKYQPHHVYPTCTVAYAFVFDDVLVLQRLQDLDLSLKVTYVLCGAVLQLLHGHHLSSVVLKWVISTHLHAAKVSLKHTTYIIKPPFFNTQSLAYI